MIQRTEQMVAWLESLQDLNEFSYEPASGDASFRRYFRIHSEGKSFIAMDAPPAKEDISPFIEVARSFEAIGLNVPHIYAEEQSLGFLLLEDLGCTLYLDRLTDESVDRLYGDALGALVTIQACGPTTGLPLYDRDLLMREMELFREWLIGRQLAVELTGDEQRMLDETFLVLADNALQQPQVCVHRDYHSRNLMVIERHNPGILDFQDAVFGPVTYDLVSLLKDCYISWPRDRIEAWVKGYTELALQSGVIQSEHEAAFLGWFDLMGVQRHLKASGIFARLNMRDGKPGYLKDIPRTLGYILSISADYPVLQGLAAFLQNRVIPAIDADSAFLGET
ncbi:MAG: phosphotransferase [Candidatus Thiodiazotropha sp. (ex Monitilora ramsayi)]|nr:phosphotransferase [Candidatus Thiodiazotropha sp. (ex Monitilora ramsayi)]